MKENEEEEEAERRKRKRRMRGRSRRRRKRRRRKWRRKEIWSEGEKEKKVAIEGLLCFRYYVENLKIISCYFYNNFSYC